MHVWAATAMGVFPKSLGDQKGKPVRAVFISDVHLGNRFSRVEAVLSFLQAFQPQHLFLVGDIIDIRELNRRWYWPAAYDRFINTLRRLAASGTQLYYTPGNHDNFLRELIQVSPTALIQDEFVFELADGRRMVVMHGDQFDSVESHAEWLSNLGTVAYSGILHFDAWVNQQLSRVTYRELRISRWLKQSTKLAVQWYSDYEQQLFTYASSKGCDGLICGHTHLPRTRTRDGLYYVNLGDWVENSTALIEHADGQLQLIDWEQELLLTTNPQVARPLPRTHRLPHSGLCLGNATVEDYVAELVSGLTVAEPPALPTSA